MKKKHIVKLVKAQREIAQKIVDQLDGSPRNVKRAQILLKADQHADGWTDKQIADAFGCTIKTVENVRQRFCEQGFDIAVGGKQRERPPHERKFDGEAEAKVIALRLSDPPQTPFETLPYHNSPPVTPIPPRDSIHGPYPLVLP